MNTHGLSSCINAHIVYTICTVFVTTNFILKIRTNSLSSLERLTCYLWVPSTAFSMKQNNQIVFNNCLLSTLTSLLRLFFSFFHDVNESIRCQVEILYRHIVGWACAKAFTFYISNRFQYIHSCKKQMCIVVEGCVRRIFMRLINFRHIFYVNENQFLSKVMYVFVYVEICAEIRYIPLRLLFHWAIAWTRDPDSNSNKLM